MGKYIFKNDVVRFCYSPDIEGNQFSPLQLEVIVDSFFSKFINSLSYLKVKIPHCVSDMYSHADYLLGSPFDSVYHPFKGLTVELDTFPVPGWITWSHLATHNSSFLASAALFMLLSLSRLLPRLISSVQTLSWVMDKPYGYFHVSKFT